jgi:hypothetical protein
MVIIIVKQKISYRFPLKARPPLKACPPSASPSGEASGSAGKFGGLVWWTVFGKFSIDSGKREVDSQALSYGLPVLVSDIPANKKVDLPAERYFRCGDVDDLKEKANSGIEGLRI